MSDYTPTTEEVRDAFSDYKEDDAGGWFKAQAGFDRWLAEVKAQAWEEGHATALRYAAYFGEHVPNPYQQGKEQ